jgi:hypothetical protein
MKDHKGASLHDAHDLLLPGLRDAGPFFGEEIMPMLTIDKANDCLVVSISKRSTGKGVCFLVTRKDIDADDYTSAVYRSKLLAALEELK